MRQERVPERVAARGKLDEGIDDLRGAGKNGDPTSSDATCQTPSATASESMFHRIVAEPAAMPPGSIARFASTLVTVAISASSSHCRLGYFLIWPDDDA